MIEKTTAKEKEYDEFLIWMIKNGHRDLIEYYKPPEEDIHTLNTGAIYMNIYHKYIPVNIRKKIEELFGDNYDIEIRTETGDEDKPGISSSWRYIQLSWET
jgi:hypothetical protein